MKTFTLHLQDTTTHQRVENVSDFIGRDASGSFGIRADHERFLTQIEFGLAQFRTEASQWQFIAAPGGLLYMRDNELFLCTRRFYLDTDYRRMSDTLERELRSEAQSLRDTRVRLKQMEDEMMKRLWRLNHER